LTQLRIVLVSFLVLLQGKFEFKYPEFN